jgi:hypothetical protein
MIYAYFGAFSPAEDDIEANQFICKANNKWVDYAEEFSLNPGYGIAAILEISDIEDFGKQLENFISQYKKEV